MSETILPSYSIKDATLRSHDFEGTFFATREFSGLISGLLNRQLIENIFFQPKAYIYVDLFYSMTNLHLMKKLTSGEIFSIITRTSKKLRNVLQACGKRGDQNESFNRFHA